MLKGKKCPRAGLRVKADPNPVSMALYSPGHGPTPGATGTVTTVPLPGAGRKTCAKGPGGGLVYVKWDDGRTFGVSRYDIAKAKGKAVVMQAAPAVYGLGAVGHDPLHNETVLKNYGKCLRKCKKKPHVGPCIDACLGEQPAPGHEALGAIPGRYGFPGSAEIQRKAQPALARDMGFKWLVRDTRSGTTQYKFFISKADAEAWNARENAGFVEPVDD